MLIRYTGEKPKKVLELNRKVYEFSPVCEVEDKEALKFLLSNEREGLFEVVKESPATDIPIQDHGGMTHPVDQAQEQLPKGRGRPKKG